MSGLIDQEGKAYFINANLYVSQQETEYWENPKEEEKASADFKPTFAHARKYLDPYKRSGRLHLFNDETQLFDCITAVPPPGHSPGHTAYRITSRDSTLIIIGDLFHYGDIQVTQPEIGTIFDYSHESAALARKNILTIGTQENLILGSSHLPFPGLGTIEVENHTYRWIPSKKKNQPMMNYSAR